MDIKRIRRKWQVDGKFITGYLWVLYCSSIHTRPSETTKDQLLAFLKQ